MPEKMDGYIVENIALESFPDFILPVIFTGHWWKRRNNPAVLCPHGHLPDKRCVKTCKGAVRTGSHGCHRFYLGYGRLWRVSSGDSQNAHSPAAADMEQHKGPGLPPVPR